MANDLLEKFPLPTRKIEDWKYTDLASLARREWRFAPTTDAADSLSDAATKVETALDRLKPFEIPVVNGVVNVPSQGLPDGVSVERKAGPDDHLSRHDTFVSNANREACGETLVLTIEGEVTTPLHFIHIGRNAAGDEEAGIAYAGRIAIRLGDNAGATLSLPAMSIDLGRDAVLGHYLHFSEAPSAVQAGLTVVVLHEHASYDAFLLQTGGGVSRRDVRVEIKGSHAEARINGAYVGLGKAHIDNTTLVTHAVPRSVSRQIFRGVLDDTSRGVFQGKVIVAEDAQRTDGKQQHKALLLSDKAEVDAKPELEIYADDVVCAHGATVGEIDADKLFYMRARGIPEREARALLVESFLMESIDEIHDETVRECLQDALAETLRRSHPEIEFEREVS